MNALLICKWWANVLELFILSVITIAIHTFVPLCAGVLNVCMQAYACMHV